VRIGFFIFIISVTLNKSYAQEIYDNSQKIMTIKKSEFPINIDGILDEPIWQIAEKQSDFWVKFPVNDILADPATIVQATYDDKYLYFAFTVIQTPGGNIVQSLKRDFGLRAGDGIGVIIDPLNEKTNGFYFSVNPYNSQTEGLITNSLDEITFTWDNTWYSETKQYDDYWTVEIAIPFNILRYESQKTVWGINFIRAAREKNQFHTWTRIPLQFTGTDLGYVGQMIWDKSPPNSGSNISINPYVISGMNIDNENGQPFKGNINTGLDAKIALSSSVNLDLTVNPDFSNVDVDEQVTNLTRFSIFFPERRVFFLENDDLFSSFGIPPIRPFYSRRIGSKMGQPVPILFGARLTGNVNKNLRFGLMNIQTGRKDDAAADNFTMATFNQRVLKRSLVTGYFINRFELQNEQEKIDNPQNRMGQNGGLEFRYMSLSGKVQGWSSTNISIKPLVNGANLFTSNGGGYYGRNFTSFIDMVHIGKNYFADLGFVNRIENYDALRDTIIRLGQNFFYNETSYNFWMKKGKLNRIRLISQNFLAYDQDFRFNELNVKPKLNFDFQNTALISLGVNFDEIDLYFPFSFVGQDATPLPAGLYSYRSYTAQFQSDRRKNFFVTLGGTVGQFYSAEFTQLQTSINIRKQPYFALAMNFEYNDLKFPQPYGDRKFWLISPQIEVNFTNNLFWTSFLQWNSQADNFNINSRLQWRFRPMSDLFIVYTDNYFTDLAFINKNRAIVFKVNYWLNI